MRELPSEIWMGSQQAVAPPNPVVAPEKLYMPSIFMPSYNTKALNFGNIIMPLTPLTPTPLTFTVQLILDQHFSNQNFIVFELFLFPFFQFDCLHSGRMAEFLHGQFERWVFQLNGEIITLHTEGTTGKLMTAKPNELPPHVKVHVSTGSWSHASTSGMLIVRSNTAM